MFETIKQWLIDCYNELFWNWNSSDSYGGGWESFNIKNFILFILFLIYGISIIYLYIK